MKIALIADTHFSPADGAPAENWTAALGWLAAVGPDLIVHLGDITANGVHDAAELKHARDILAQATMPMRLVPGNHDIGDHPPGPGVAPHDPLDLQRLAEYREILGMDWWTVPATPWLLIGLNALVLGTGNDMEAAQYRWLEDAIADHGGPVGVFLHKPLFAERFDEDIVHERYIPRAARLRLLKILAGSDVRFFAAGHTHQMRRFKSGGIEHIWVPSAAFTIPDAIQERIGDKLVGMMMLEIGAGGHRFTPIVPAGIKANSLLDFVRVYPELKKKYPGLIGRTGQ